MTDQKVTLAMEFGRAILELKSYIRQSIQDKLKTHNVNITVEMLEVLSVLWESDGVNQQEIADRTLRDKSSMTYLIDNLAKRGMVKRVEDDCDRRNKLIFLSNEAIGLKQQLHPWLADVYTKATAQADIEGLQTSIVQINKMILSLKGDGESPLFKKPLGCG